MKTERKSNMELLRILAMLMIICFHMYHYRINFQLTDAATISRLGNGWFNEPVFFKRIMLLSTFAPLGKIGDVIFILISGFFMAERESINLKKIVVKLFSQQIYAVLSLTAISLIVWKFFSRYYVHLLEFNMINQMSWFIGYYFLIMVIAYFFLNKYLNKLDQKHYLTFVLVLFGMTQFTYAFSVINAIEGIGYICIGVFLYSLGGYIKKFDPFRKIKTYVLILIIIASFALIYLSSYISTNLDIENYIYNGYQGVFYQRIPKYTDYSFICLVIGLALFEIFKRIDIGSNKVINFLGSSTLLLYLLHDNDFVRHSFPKIDWITPLYNNPWQFICNVILLTLAEFVFGVLMYSLYALIDKTVIRRIKDKISVSYDDKLSKE